VGEGWGGGEHDDVSAGAGHVAPVSVSELTVEDVSTGVAGAYVNTRMVYVLHFETLT